MAQQTPSYRAYVAWDLPTRLFHWVNALAVIGLLATGIAILSDDALGFSAEGKVLLKSVHVSFGYVMALNLLWRFVWAFFGLKSLVGCREAPGAYGGGRWRQGRAEAAKYGSDRIAPPSLVDGAAC